MALGLNKSVCVCSSATPGLVKVVFALEVLQGVFRQRAESAVHAVEVAELMQPPLHALHFAALVAVAHGFAVDGKVVRLEKLQHRIADFTIRRVGRGTGRGAGRGRKSGVHHAWLFARSQ